MARKRKETVCPGGVWCRQGPGRAGSEWVGRPGSPDRSETVRETRPQEQKQREGAWLQWGEEAESL